MRTFSGDPMKSLREIELEMEIKRLRELLSAKDDHINALKRERKALETLLQASLILAKNSQDFCRSVLRRVERLKIARRLLEEGLDVRLLCCLLRYWNPDKQRCEFVYSKGIACNKEEYCKTIASIIIWHPDIRPRAENLKQCLERLICRFCPYHPKNKLVR